MFRLKTQKRIFKTLIVSFLFAVFSISNAVNLENQDINLKFNPEFPSANESVTVSTEIYITDINQATISWFIDGILKSKAIGEKEFTFRTKGFGEVIDLTVQISASQIKSNSAGIILKVRLIFQISEAYICTVKSIT
ncbi:hypothetical protein KJ603_02260, partial [Patescibacteria group bacterium]|nr:hypothetical protein [Patescibacteria group bacterium]